MATEEVLACAQRNESRRDTQEKRSTKMRDESQSAHALNMKMKNVKKSETQPHEAEAAGGHDRACLSAHSRLPHVIDRDFPKIPL